MTTRAYKFEYNGETCYIKFEVIKKPLLLVTWQKRLSKLLDMPIITPTYTLEGIHQESRRIEEFRAHGITVPGIIEEKPDYLILSDIGLNLSWLLKNMESEEERYILVQKALHALTEIHAQNMCHSRPLLKDVVYDQNNDRIGFVDLEENAASVMPMPSAVARDYALFMCSAGRYLRRDYHIAIARQIDWNAPNINKKELRTLVRLLFPFAWIQQIFFPQKRGNEVAGAFAAIVVLRSVLSKTA